MSPQLYTVVVNGMGVPMLVPQNTYPGQDVTGGNSVYTNTGQTDAITLNDSANALGELAALHNILLTGNQLISTGSAGEPQQIPISTIRKPWLDAPDNAVPFDPAGAATLGVVGTQIIPVTFTVPDGMDGVINAYSWNFIGGGFVQGSGDLIAQVFRNDAPIRNYDNILVEKGSVAIPRPIAPLRIFSGQIISLVVSHVANALLNGNVVASFVGYFYPSQG
jgi:hypothetical protein